MNKLFIQTILFHNKFSIDILYKINSIIINNNKKTIFWKKITNRLLYNRSIILDNIYYIHNYARDIHEFAHKLYDRKFVELGNKYINIGCNIHKLAENLINKTIKLYSL